MSGVRLVSQPRCYLWAGCVLAEEEAAACDAEREAVFGRANGLIRTLEEDPSQMPTGECDGRPFFIEFDAATGVPTRVDNNTPCDGGRTWEITFRTIPMDGEEQPIDLTLSESSSRDGIDDITLASWVPELRVG